MKRIVLTLLLTAVFGASMVVVGSAPAGACSCVGFTDAQALAAADAAFIGTVDRVDRPRQLSSSSDPVTWAFTVDGVFKGDVAARQEVVSAFSSASCGVTLDVGTRYLVFARIGETSGQPVQLSASACGGTRPAEPDEVPAGFPPLRLVSTKTPTHRMVPSDRTVVPGQVVTVTVHGPGVEQWGGGVNSYFERRRDDGSWQRLYMLLWPANSAGEPSITDLDGAHDDLGVQATPFQVLIPAVEPGVYRISRRFLTVPGYSPEEKTLSARVKVNACPKGQRPTFSPPAPTGYQYGTPGCAAENR